MNVPATCKRDGSDTVVANLQVGMQLQRGPAAPGRTARLAYFVAVLDGEKHTWTSRCSD